MASQYPSTPETYQRTRSSVLKSFIHKRSPSAGDALPPPTPTDVFIAMPAYDCGPTLPFVPQESPYNSRALGERQQNRQSQPPPSPAKRSKEGKRPTTSGEGGGGVNYKSLHKKTLSSISLKSLAGRDIISKPSKTKDAASMRAKKTKSASNFATLLSRPKSSKSLKKQALEDEARIAKDKENRSPQRSPVISSPVTASRPPIYAQFSSEHFTKQPLGGKFLEDEIDLYTPENYSPGKQRNFYNVQGSQPSFAQRDGDQRPKSTYLPSNYSVQDISRKPSRESQPRRSSEIAHRVVSGEKRPSCDRRTTEPSNPPDNKAAPSRGQRVLAAVSSFGGGSSKKDDSEPLLEDKDIDREFEAMLDRRNIPENMRGKMRSLTIKLKRDFVKQDWAETAAARNGRPGTNGSNSSAEPTTDTAEVEVKSKRPRSRTFTLSRASSKESSSSTKSKKPEESFKRHSRMKSSDSTKVDSKSLMAAGAVAQTLIAKAKGQTPEDFVTYLRKNQQPEKVEVGRLHKLRLLLRNETVAWTDDFVGQGGMAEIVGLLHRTMEVEWREEHEDALLHEVLLCLKALSTTALALEYLDNIQSTLFPAVLHMIFDEEKKGPSEFTTRNIITSLLFTYLKSAPLALRTLRAKTILSYLHNQDPSESQRPVDFVLDMRRPRPYTVWNKEVSNVTKEVFWIFLHNLNVVSLPRVSKDNVHDTTASSIASSGPNGLDIANPYHVYMAKHFPPELPPVPAAPYVGGVEWEATNYLASHLDLVNGIMACLPTQAERNDLREQMRVSGWEKCMGGTLRLCKEKFYGGVHAGLRCWVAAAAEDGWNTREVRCGPSTENSSPKKTPKKAAAVQEPPKIQMKLSFAGEGQTREAANGGGGWL